jgi:hypothetical protein
MPATKIEGFRQEFPWIWDYVSEKIERAYVQGIEAQLLDYIPAANVHGDSESGSWIVYESILFLDKDHKLVSRETEDVTYPRKYRFFGQKIEKRTPVKIVTAIPDQQLRHTLERLGDEAKKIHGILSYFKDTRTVIFYKTPKNMSLLEWIEMQVSLARREFSEKCAAIDALAP